MKTLASSALVVVSSVEGVSVFSGVASGSVVVFASGVAFGL
jgi:hypothetical protein